MTWITFQFYVDKKNRLTDETEPEPFGKERLGTDDRTETRYSKAAERGRSFWTA